MQALHASFGIGALVGPALVGLIGYKPAFQLMALLLISAATIALIHYLSPSAHVDQNDEHSSDSNSCGINKSSSDQGIEMQSRTAAVESTQREAEPRADGDGNNATTVSTDSSGQEVPVIVQVLCFFFFFVYVGIETGFGGWVPTFSLKEHITDDEARAAYLTAVFYGSLAVGRIASVPISLYLSSTSMIRVQLLVSLIGSLAFFFVGSRSYLLAYISCSIFGAGLSALFPLMLVLPIDYGLIMSVYIHSMLVCPGLESDVLLLMFFIGMMPQHPNS